MQAFIIPLAFYLISNTFVAMQVKKMWLNYGQVISASVTSQIIVIANFRLFCKMS